MAGYTRRRIRLLAWALTIGWVTCLALFGHVAADDDDDDDREHAVIIQETGGDTRVTEGDGEDGYTIALYDAPRRRVTIRVTADGQVAASPSELTFDRLDWWRERHVTVVAVDDYRAEGDHRGTIRHRATSDDRGYDGIDIPEVVVAITDDDVVGVSIAPRELDMVEGDADVGYEAALTSEPTAVVTLHIAANGLTSASPPEMRFGPDDWQEPRWIAVTAADDATHQGTRTSEVRHSVASDDATYDGLPVDSVTVTVRDNDRAEVVVEAGATEITTRDGSASLVLRLSSPPTAEVVIPLSASSEWCRLSSTAVRLTPDTWQAGVRVTVTANVAASWAGEEACTVAVGPASSSDGAFDGLDPGDVVVTIRIARGPTILCLPAALRAWPPAPGTPVMQPIDNPEGWGDYSVAWGAADRAKGYLLHEATDAGFATGRQVYAGPGLTHRVTGRGAGRYFYRVAATNAWGTGQWSSAVAVDVRWESEPNDDALTEANGPIVPEVTYHGVLADDADGQDYYWLELSAPARIEVWLDAIPTGQNDDLVLRDASLNLVGYSGELGSQGEHLLTEEVMPVGRYYTQVYRRSGGGSLEPYSLRYALR